MGILVVSLVLLSVWVGTSLGLPNGAPNDVCENLIPGHGVTPQTTEPPVRLVIGKNEASSGELIRIRLESSNNDYFKGFVIQARDTQQTEARIGTFTFARGNNGSIKHMDCSPGIQNSITHSNNGLKFELEAFWVVPTDFEGDVVFRYTIVKDFSTVWVGLESQRLRVTQTNILANLGGTTRQPNGTAITNIWQGIQDLFPGTSPIIQGLRNRPGTSNTPRPIRNSPITFRPNPATQVSGATRRTTTSRALVFQQSQFFLRSTLPPLNCTLNANYSDCIQENTESTPLAEDNQSTTSMNGIQEPLAPLDSLVPLEETDEETFPGPPLMVNQELDLGGSGSGNISNPQLPQTSPDTDDAVIIQALRQQQLDREIQEQLRLQQQLQEQIRQLQELRQQTMSQSGLSNVPDDDFPSQIGGRPFQESDVIQLSGDDESVQFSGSRPSFASSGTRGSSIQPEGVIQPISQNDQPIPSLGSVSSSFNSQNAFTQLIQQEDNFLTGSPQRPVRSTARPFGSLAEPIRNIPAVQPIIQGSGIQSIQGIPSSELQTPGREPIRRPSPGNRDPNQSPNVSNFQQSPLQDPSQINNRPNRPLRGNNRRPNRPQPSQPGSNFRQTTSYPRRQRPRITTPGSRPAFPVQNPVRGQGFEMGVPELNQNDEDRLLMQLLLTSGGIRNILLATLQNQARPMAQILRNGFLSTSKEYGKKPTHESQFISPLMANFSPPSPSGGQVKYAEVRLETSDSEIVVQWVNMSLTHQENLGTFSFQTSVQENGDINFMYRNVPNDVLNSVQEHPTTKIGLADDLHSLSNSISKDEIITDNLFNGALRKTTGFHIQTDTSVLWQPLSPCQEFDTCENCLGFKDLRGPCQWCESAQLCSTGSDGNKGNWEQNGCAKEALTDQCSFHLQSKDEELPNKRVIDDHDYYLCIMEPMLEPKFLKHWVSMDHEDVQVVDNLSNQKLSSFKVTLDQFPFIFYGHELEYLYVTTEGFLSLGSQLHSAMHLVQYIAPLRANFDFSVSNRSQVLLLHDAAKLTVEWSNVTLEHHEAVGPFTFQVSLMASGDLTFAYKDVPNGLAKVALSRAETMFNETFLVGISDAFKSEQALYEYHNVAIDLRHIGPHSVIRFKSRLTCHQLTDCRSCLATNLPTFHCEWCPATQSCSSGMDRLRERWHSNQCQLRNVSNPSMCHLGTLSKIVEFHEYYNTTTILDPELIGQRLWVEGRKFKKVPFENFVKVELSFPFPFYGTPNYKLFILPEEGIVALDSPPEEHHFIYASEIAPLGMTLELDLLDPLSRVAYWDDGSQIVIEWRNVIIKSGGHSRRLKVSFQVQLRSNGTIIFFYKALEGKLQQSWIQKLGISDSYISHFSDPLDFLMGGPHMGQYHRIDIRNQTTFLSNETAIIIEPLQSCKDNYNCGSCLKFGPECHWCPSLGKCALRGLDKGRQEWIDQGCLLSSISGIGSIKSCPNDQPDKKSNIQDELVKFERNITDQHKFYKLTLSKDVGVFENVHELLHMDDPDVIYLSTISNYFRQKDDLTLEFEFPFYGQYLRKVSVISAGFLSVPSVQHANIIQSQYIAPLMSDFDASSNRHAYVLAKSTKEALVVEWVNVTIRNQFHMGPFSFQVQLRPNGDIRFVYVSIPVALSSIDDEAHPLSIGLSDAYYIENLSHDPREIASFHKMFIYHDLDLKLHMAQIGNGTVILLEALPSCNQFQSCWECTSGNTEFNCVWCPALKACSNGYDRNRQKWTNQLCHLSHHGIKNLTHCPLELVQSRHEYYNQTFHTNPLLYNSSPEEDLIPSEERSFRTEENSPTEFIPFRLSFPFKFYGITYHSLLLSPLGFLSLFDENSEDQGIKNQIAPLKNITQENTGTPGKATLTFGLGPNRFVAIWNETHVPQLAFGVVLRDTGDIFFKYWNVPEDFEEHDYFVGIGTTFPVTQSKQSQVFRVDVPVEHIAHGLSIHYEPLKQCSEAFQCSDCIQHGCIWCHGDSACRPETTFCSTSNLTSHLGSKECPLKISSSLSSVITDIAIGLVVIFAATSGFVLAYGWQHPGSWPGQILVQLRVTSQHFCHGSEQLREGHEVSWERRASVTTTETTMSTLS
eukprot:maker-scaffold82_size396747-snap-gene-1.24 protein:Tk06826 transcript:maker-scaffold82_size396747-snap-gene-1.24-mRNA-1 annotation:"plexin domain-containing protein 2"